MQIYCGTDIIEVSRIEDAVKNTKGFKGAYFRSFTVWNVIFLAVLLGVWMVL